MPEINVNYKKGETVGTIESVKAASDIYSPVSGLIVEKNEQLNKNPFYINKSSYEKGYFILFYILLIFFLRLAI